MPDTTDLTALDPQLFAQLIVLAETDPNHPAIVAARLAVELIDSRHDLRHAMAEASQDLCGSPEGRDYAAHTRLAQRVRDARVAA